MSGYKPSTKRMAPFQENGFDSDHVEAGDGLTELSPEHTVAGVVLGMNKEQIEAEIVGQIAALLRAQNAFGQHRGHPMAPRQLHQCH